MSIRSFNKFIGASGCVVVLSVVLAILFILQFAGQGLFGGGGPDSNGQPGDQVIVSVYGTNITDKMVDTAYTNAMSQAIKGGQSPTPDPMTVFQMTGQALSQSLTPAMAMQVAKMNNIKITDPDVLNAYVGSLQQMVELRKQQIKAQGGFKSPPTPAQIDQAFTQQVGKSPTQVISDAQSTIKAQLADPKQRMGAVAGVAEQIVTQKLTDQSKPTLDQLKATYVSMKAQRVFLNGDSADKTAAIVEQKAKGGTSFTDLIDQYSQDKSNTKQKLSSVEITLGHNDLTTAPLSALATLKAGAISDPIQTEGGVAIYKVISIAPSLPKDFDKNSALLLNSLAQSQGQATYDAAIQKLQASAQFDWKSVRWKAFWDVYTAATHAKNPTKIDWKSLVAEVKSAQTAPSPKVPFLGADKAIALAGYVAYSGVLSAASAADQKAVIPDFIQAATAAKNFCPGGALDLQIAQYLVQSGNTQGAGKALLAAANDNQDLTDTGQAIYMQTRSSAETYLKKKYISQADYDAIQTALKTYLQSRADQVQQQQEALKAQAEAQAESAREKAQYEAAQKKQGNAAPSAPTGSSSGASGVTPSPSPSSSTTGASQPFGSPSAPATSTGSSTGTPKSSKG